MLTHSYAYKYLPVARKQKHTPLSLRLTRILPQNCGGSAQLFTETNSFLQYFFFQTLFFSATQFVGKAAAQHYAKNEANAFIM